MIKFIKAYFRMKMNEWKVKAQVYGAVAAFLENQSDIADFMKNVYESLKDVSGDELKDMLVTKVAKFSIEKAKGE